MEIKPNVLIIRHYKRFFTFVFKYFFLLLALVLSGFFFQKIFLTTTLPNGMQDNLTIQKIKLVGTFEKLLKRTVKDNDVQVYILQGPLLIQNNFLVSQDNLITYKGFIMPRNLAIATSLPLKQASYFDKTNYDTGELLQFIRNFVLVTQDNISHGIQNTQLPLSNGLIKNFNLSCLGESVLYSKTCAHFLSTFLDEFFVYQLNTDYAGLKKVFSSIKQSSYRTRFCDGMKKYLLYANDTSAQLSDIFEQCGTGYTEFYKRMGFFVDIQQQLADKYISADVYKDPLLNVYKLLSYQQILYQDFQELKIRKNQYTLYLAFVQEAIKRHALPHFYVDELYRYNTYYLKPTLFTTRYDRRWSSIKEGEIMDVIKRIDTINIGDRLSNSSGLALLVSNASLIESPNTTATAASLTIQEQIAKKMAAVTYFTVAQSTINNTTVDTQGYFLMGDMKIPAMLTLAYENDGFVVRFINIPSYTELTTVLQGLIKTRDTSIGEFFATMSQNLPLYQNSGSTVKDLLSMCAEIRDLEPGLAMQVSTCTQDVVVLSKINNSTPITYTFLLQNFFPTNITVSDDTIQSAVENAVKQDNYAPSSIIDVITFVLAVQPTTTTIHRGSTNTLLTLEDFQKFLGIEAKDIAEKDGVILVDFTLANVNLIAEYNIIKHQITSLYFKDILSNGKPLPIQGFVLTMDDNHQSNIDTFVKDPLAYIKKIDLTAWKNYTNK